MLDGYVTCFNLLVELGIGHVAHEHDVAHIDLALERIARLAVELLEELDVPKQEPPASIVLTADAAVDEILVHEKRPV